MSKSNARETLRIAHTARCKLQLAADRPDRNFRFILGHALTLDSIMLRMAQIEITGDADSDSDDDGMTVKKAQAPAHIGFAGSENKRSGSPRPQRRASPPPPPPGLDDDDDDEDDVDEDDDDDDDGAPLERFPSASAAPPRLTEEQLKNITGQHGNDNLVDMYNTIAGCPCVEHANGKQAPKVQNVWEVPPDSAAQVDGAGGPTMALVQVGA